MRVLRINRDFAPSGGITRYIHEIVPRLRHRGVEEFHLTFTASDQKLPAAVELYHIPAPSNWRADRYIQDFTHVLETCSPDLVHFHDYPVPTFVEVSAKRVPTVVSLHGYGSTCPGTQYFQSRGEQICHRDFGPACLVYAYLKRCNNRHPRRLIDSYLRVAHERKLANTAQAYIVRAEYHKEILLQHDYEPDRIHVLPHVVDTSKFGELDPRSENVVLFVGRLSSLKGVQYLLRAMQQVTTPCMVAIVGEGNYRSHLEALADLLPSRHQVCFAGWLGDKDLAVWYSKARVLIVPSIWPEVFGAVGLEAMASSVPVVAFDVGGIPSWLKDSENGFLVPPKDVATLASRIQQLLENRTMAKTMGQCGRQMADAQYTVEQHVSQLMRLYNNLIGTSVNASN